MSEAMARMGVVYTLTIPLGQTPPDREKNASTTSLQDLLYAHDLALVTETKRKLQHNWM